MAAAVQLGRKPDERQDVAVSPDRHDKNTHSIEPEDETKAGPASLERAPRPHDSLAKQAAANSSKR